MIGIYKFTNKINRKVYIGKSVNVEGRRKYHLRTYNKSKAPCYFYNALNKYGPENFDFEVLLDLDWLKSYSKDEKKKYMDIWEKFMIMYYKSNNQEFGYNMTIGGDGQGGCIPWNKGLNKETDERVRKISENKPKRDLSGINNPMYGKNAEDYMTPEAIKIKREKQSKALKNRKRNPETVEKVRKSNTGKKRNTKQKENISLGTINGMHKKENWDIFLNAVRESNKKKIGCKYMNNGKERKLVKPDDFDYYLSLNWVFGRNISIK